MFPTNTVNSHTQNRMEGFAILPWVRGSGILDMAVPVSMIHIHSRVHSFMASSMPYNDVFAKLHGISLLQSASQLCTRATALSSAPSCSKALSRNGYYRGDICENMGAVPKR